MSSLNKLSVVSLKLEKIRLEDELKKIAHSDSMDMRGHDVKVNRRYKIEERLAQIDLELSRASTEAVKEFVAGLDSEVRGVR